MRPETAGVVCTHASNLTGNLTDIRRIGRFCREHSLCFVVDAAQTAGIFPIDMEEDGIDVLCFTGHKASGTTGNRRTVCAGGSGAGGALRGRQRSAELSEGAAFRDARAPGSGDCECTWDAGLLAAVRWLERTGISVIRERETKLAQQFYLGIRSVKGVTVYGDVEDTLPENHAPVIALNIEGAASDEVCDELAQEYGIAVRGALIARR